MRQVIFVEFDRTRQVKTGGREYTPSQDRRVILTPSRISSGSCFLELLRKLSGQVGSGLGLLDLDCPSSSVKRCQGEACVIASAPPLAPSRFLCSIRSVATIAESPNPFAFNRFPHCLNRGVHPTLLC
jgi:hypothetical protein